MPIASKFHMYIYHNDMLKCADLSIEVQELLSDLCTKKELIEERLVEGVSLMPVKLPEDVTPLLRNVQCRCARRL